MYIYVWQRFERDISLIISSLINHVLLVLLWLAIMVYLIKWLLGLICLELIIWKYAIVLICFFFSVVLIFLYLELYYLLLAKNE